MKKSILILALCFILMFAVATVSAQEAETPAEETVEEIIAEEEPLEEAVLEEPSAEDAAVDEPAEETAAEETSAPACEKPADSAAFTVTYYENNCLAKVPADCNSYAAGDEVTVLFEPVEYLDYKTFFGWDMNDDGIADFGYSYDKFTMPEENVELKAICVAPSWGRTTCQDCHLHGVYVDQGLQTFEIVPLSGK